MERRGGEWGYFLDQGSEVVSSVCRSAAGGDVGTALAFNDVVPHEALFALFPPGQRLFA
jgi:hypothetical protein